MAELRLIIRSNKAVIAAGAVVKQMLAYVEAETELSSGFVHSVYTDYLSLLSVVNAANNRYSA